MAGLNSSDLDSDDTGSVIANINITPFVDVVLVLLIIFIVTAPMLVKDLIEIKLPKASQSDRQRVETLGIAVNREGRVLVNGVPSDDESVKRTVREALAKNPEAQAVIAGDSEAAYGGIVHAIDLIKQAGLNRFAIQIEKEAP